MPQVWSKSAHDQATPVAKRRSGLCLSCYICLAGTFGPYTSELWKMIHMLISCSGERLYVRSRSVNIAFEKWKEINPPVGRGSIYHEYGPWFSKLPIGRLDGEWVANPLHWPRSSTGGTD